MVSRKPDEKIGQEARLAPAVDQAKEFLGAGLGPSPFLYEKVLAGFYRISSRWTFRLGKSQAETQSDSRSDHDSEDDGVDYRIVYEVFLVNLALRVVQGDIYRAHSRISEDLSLYGRALSGLELSPDDSFKTLSEIQRIWMRISRKEGFELLLREHDSGKISNDFQSILSELSYLKGPAGHVAERFYYSSLDSHDVSAEQGERYSWRPKVGPPVRLESVPLPKAEAEERVSLDSDDLGEFFRMLLGIVKERLLDEADSHLEYVRSRAEGAMKKNV